MSFREDASALIQKKKFDDFEALWMNQIESDPSDVEAFLNSAKALRKAEQRTQSDTLLGLLGDALKEKQLWPQRLQVLKELGRLSKHPAHIRPQIEEALRKSIGDHKNFDRAFQFANFNDPQSNPVERAEKIEMWLTYDEGECFFMAGRGAGVVTELNPELGICRLDFEKDKRVSVPLGAAAKFLLPLPKGHVLREKFSDGDKLKASAKSSPSEFFARILQSFGRPMMMAEVRDAVIGIVPEEKWSSWWTAARKNPQVVTSGTGAKATYAFAGSAGDAATAIRRDFDRADVKTKLELARKHSGRSRAGECLLDRALRRSGAARAHRRGDGVADPDHARIAARQVRRRRSTRPRCSRGPMASRTSPASTTSRCARKRWRSCARIIPTGRRSSPSPSSSTTSRASSPRSSASSKRRDRPTSAIA
jgi:hypothetical protein